jgi:hypothetical protein
MAATHLSGGVELCIPNLAARSSRLEAPMGHLDSDPLGSPSRDERSAGGRELSFTSAPCSSGSQPLIWVGPFGLGPPRVALAGRALRRGARAFPRHGRWVRGGRWPESSGPWGTRTPSGRSRRTSAPPGGRELSLAMVPGFGEVVGRNRVGQPGHYSEPCQMSDRPDPAQTACLFRPAGSASPTVQMSGSYRRAASAPPGTSSSRH